MHATAGRPNYRIPAAGSSRMAWLYEGNQAAILRVKWQQNPAAAIFFTSDSLIAFIVEVLHQLLLLKIVDDLVLLFYLLVKLRLVLLNLVDFLV
jgi:hypothetical protein